MSGLLAVLAGTARLSRRDRAALTLALECARAGADTDALHALECADGGLSGAVHRALIYADVADYWSGDDDSNGRARRARLALLLRLVLRCDAGDQPPTWVPLWERAPATRAR